MTESAVDGTRYRTILGIRFFVGSVAEAVKLGLSGGLVVVPAAPVLVGLERDAPTRVALLHSDLAITDSGLMVLLWNLLKMERIHRVSGLRYLKLLLETPELKQQGVMFWVMPNQGALKKTMAWMLRAGYPVTEADFYVAPYYDPGTITDPDLLRILLERKSRQIFIAIGGGVQERLGFYLQKRLSHRPAIHCIGAAIGFLTGDQVRIPMWADRVFLGWFFRCLSAPGIFIPRYRKASRLVFLLWKYRERLPIESGK
jgi:UDP-N-acetyl-D-mannosaminuronic acid transferase (WecB/TagA/CpsF family)